MRQAPLQALLREAAEPHAGRGKQIVFAIGPSAEDGTRQPTVLRRPEVIHGLRNLIQNAVDFARGTVWVAGDWTDSDLTVRIIDDGRGFPPQVLSRLGEPFIRPRRSAAERSDRPGYEGMGLGLFIAKTLLERSGAVVRFANAGEPGLLRGGPAGTPQLGAMVEVIWPLGRIVAEPGKLIGRNRPITA